MRTVKRAKPFNLLLSVERFFTPSLHPKPLIKQVKVCRYDNPLTTCPKLACRSQPTFSPFPKHLQHLAQHLDLFLTFENRGINE